MSENAIVLAMAISGVVCTLLIWAMRLAGMKDYCDDTEWSRTVLILAAPCITAHWLSVFAWVWQVIHH